jgi:hypothetical protein
MSQELGVLSMFDGRTAPQSPSISLILLRWLLWLPHLFILILLRLAFLVTSILAYFAVLFTAKLPHDRFVWNRKVMNWTWRVGFYSLEEFIYRKWPNVNWGSHLELHTTAKHSGRQFPAGSWNIDFLARDANTNGLIVVHLKRGEASEATVGQILRHISWIRENVAESGQDVRGVIVARQSDPALEYAVKNLPFVEVMTYTVDFQLTLHPTKASKPHKTAGKATKEEKQAVGQPA